MKCQNLALLFLVIFSSTAQNADVFFKLSNDFFNANVEDGNVDYETISENPLKLDDLLNFAQTIEIPEIDKNAYQAFWINTYNLIVIKEVINHYPLNSPLDVNGFFDKKKHQAGGEMVTLNEIENDLLRAKFNDPRIHFVLVCGAKGCPPIINEAYMPGTVNDQLTQQTKKAINGNFIKVNPKKKKVLVSQIMEWYKSDFVQDGDEIDFLNQYLNEPLPAKTKLGYFTYDWRLNEK